MDNFDRCEAEYNRNYDPYPEAFCDMCEAIERDLCICGGEEE